MYSKYLLLPLAIINCTICSSMQDNNFPQMLLETEMNNAIFVNSMQNNNFPQMFLETDVYEGYNEEKEKFNK